jgi:hypothetical protein
LKRRLIAFVFGLFSIGSLAATAGVDDASQISAAIDAYYLAHVYSHAAWTNVRISEVGPYAIFEAENRETGIQALLQDIDGTWKVTLPGKGIILPDLLTSVGIPLDTADRLLAICPPLSRATHPASPLRDPANRAIFGSPSSYRSQLGGRLIQSTIRSVILPAVPVLLHETHSGGNRREVVAPASGIFCS